jgi:hypothetical protein
MEADSPLDSTFCAGADIRVEFADENHAVWVEEAFAGFQRRGIGKQVVEGGAEGVDITAYIGVAGISTVLLQGGVEGGAPTLDDGDGGVISGEDLYQAKVNQFDNAVGGEFEVAGFDVTMEDGRVLAVEVDESIGQLFGPVEHLAFFQELFTLAGFDHKGAEVFTGDEIHDQEIALALGEDIGDFGEVGVVKAGEDIGLTLELVAGLLLGL